MFSFIFLNDCPNCSPVSFDIDCQARPGVRVCVCLRISVRVSRNHAVGRIVARMCIFLCECVCACIHACMYAPFHYPPPPCVRIDNLFSNITRNGYILLLDIDLLSYV